MLSRVTDAGFRSWHDHGADDLAAATTHGGPQGRTSAVAGQLRSATSGPIRTIVFACDAGMGSSAMGLRCSARRSQTPVFWGERRQLGHRRPRPHGGPGDTQSQLTDRARRQARTRFTSAWTTSSTPRRMPMFLRCSARAGFALGGDVLAPGMVRIHPGSVTRDEALQEATDMLVGRVVTPACYAAMQDRERAVSTYIGHRTGDPARHDRTQGTVLGTAVTFVYDGGRLGRQARDLRRRHRRQGQRTPGGLRPDRSPVLESRRRGEAQDGGHFRRVVRPARGRAHRLTAWLSQWARGGCSAVDDRDELVEEGRHVRAGVDEALHAVVLAEHFDELLEHGLNAARSLSENATMTTTCTRDSPQGIGLPARPTAIAVRVAVMLNACGTASESVNAVDDIRSVRCSARQVSSITPSATSSEPRRRMIASPGVRVEVADERFRREVFLQLGAEGEPVAASCGTSSRRRAPVRRRRR